MLAAVGLLPAPTCPYWAHSEDGDTFVIGLHGRWRPWLQYGIACERSSQEKAAGGTFGEEVLRRFGIGLNAMPIGMINH